MTLLVHILGGGLGIVSGFVALSAAKGGKLHRGSGRLFVYAMLTMSFGGVVIATLFKPSVASVIGGLLTAYLVITALTTVSPPAGWSRRLDVGLMLVAAAVGLTGVTVGFEALASASGRMDGLPPFPFFMHGVVALLAGAGDVRMLRLGGVHGAPRLARHLWRMCWALWIATASFFLGQAKVIPKPVRIPVLLALPVAVLVTMLYWLWRVRRKRTYQLRGGPLGSVDPQGAHV